MNIILIRHLDNDPSQADFLYDDGGYSDAEWAVTNPAWNKRLADLLDEDLIDTFVLFVAHTLKVMGIRDVWWCDVRNTYMFITAKEITL